MSVLFLYPLNFQSNYFFLNKQTRVARIMAMNKPPKNNEPNMSVALSVLIFPEISIIAMIVTDTAEKAIHIQPK